MLDALEKISQAKAEELEDLLRAVLDRYAVLFPDWEITTVSFQKGMDKNKDIDQFVELLTKMKTLSADDALPS